jgi:hypothetical protein
MKNIKLLFLVFAISVALIGANQILMNVAEADPGGEQCSNVCGWGKDPQCDGSSCWFGENCTWCQSPDYVCYIGQTKATCYIWCGEDPC